MVHISNNFTNKHKNTVFPLGFILKRLTGRWRTALASSFFIAYPSRGTCSILPLWVKSRCVPGGNGWTSGRGVGPTGGGTSPCSTPSKETNAPSQVLVPGGEVGGMLASVVSSHMGLLPGSERLPVISWPLRSTHQQ